MNTQSSVLVYVTFALGAMAVYLLLPRAGRSTKIAGTLIGLIALATAMVLCAGKFLGASGGNAIFYLSAVIAIASAVKVITDEKPVYSALYFVLTVIAITPLLILQHAEFLAIALIIIYAGAILVTYVFVIMLAQQSGDAPIYDRRARQPLSAVFAGFVTMAVIAGQMAVLPQEQAVAGTFAAATASGDAPADADNTAQIGSVMLTQYVVAFELAGVLLLIAMVGAIALSKKRVPSEISVAPTKPPGQIGREVEPY